MLGCSGSYGAPGGGACSGYLLRVGRHRRSGSTAATARFGHLQEHIDGRGPHRGRAHPRASRPLRRHLRPARAACATASGIEDLPGVRARGAREAPRCRWSTDWGDTFDWRAVGDGDTATVGDVDLRVLAHRPPAAHVRGRGAPHDGRRLIYTADTGPGLDASDAFGPAPTSCSRRPRTCTTTSRRRSTSRPSRPARRPARRRPSA